MVVLAAVTQPAATAGTGVDIEIERTAHQRHPGPGVGVGTAGRASRCLRPGGDPSAVLSSGTQGLLREPKRPMARRRSPANQLFDYDSKF